MTSTSVKPRWRRAAPAVIAARNSRESSTVSATPPCVQPMHHRHPLVVVRIRVARRYRPRRRPTRPSTARCAGTVPLSTIGFGASADERPDASSGLRAAGRRQDLHAPLGRARAASASARSGRSGRGRCRRCGRARSPRSSRSTVAAIASIREKPRLARTGEASRRVPRGLHRRAGSATPDARQPYFGVRYASGPRHRIRVLGVRSVAVDALDVHACIDAPPVHAVA